MNELAELMGRSPAMESLRANLRRLVASGSGSHRPPAILIQGETGTGKGLVASLLHQLGPRRNHAFVDVNCAAIPETLLESELFGFERGAFTDARRSKPGLLQAAHRGTIFLDEIGLLSETLQPKLLKAIEEHSVRRLGATQNEPADAWVLSASNSDLRMAIRERRFREDLYHRLAVLTLTLPPLRERGEDVLLLAEHFLARACADYGLPARALAPDARARILAYSWPGNVRELANTMERAALLVENARVTAAVLDLKETPASPQVEPDRRVRTGSLDDATRGHLREVLDQTGGNISRTAAILGITRNTVRAHIRKFGLRVGGAEETPRPAPGPAEAADSARDTARPGGREMTAAPRQPAFRWERRLIAALSISLSAPSDAAVSQLSSTQHELVKELRSFGAGRAGHAALSMLRGVEGGRGEQARGVKARFAVHSSHCLIAQGIDMTGMDSTDKQRVHTILGRLIESAEPNTIVVTHAAAELLQRRFELEATGVVAEPPDRMYCVVGPGHTGFEVGGQALSPFVDREQDLSALHGLLAHAEEGRGQVVGIVGEPGVGKSRLVYEFRRALTPGRVTYLEGRCLSYGNTIPYFPIIDIVRRSFALVESDTEEVVDERVRTGLQALAMDPEEWAPYLLHLLGYKEGTESLAVLSPDLVKTRTMEALRTMSLEASRQRPIVVAIDDLQWVDPTSAEALSSLAETLAACPILLLATYRPGYQPPWLGRSYASQLALQRLTRSDSLAVVHSVVPKRDLPPPLEQTILSHAEGIPFFLEELARAVAEHQDLRSEVMVPNTIEDVIMARLDRLPAEERELLQTASVIGRDVSVPILGAVTDLPEPVLSQRLARLQAAEFLHLKRFSPAAEYTFKHALTYEVAHESVLAPRRRDLHARVFEAIEAIYPDRLSEHVDRLARHAFRGEVWDKAVTYLRRAGERALKSSANQEGAEFFEDALSALRHLPETPSALEHAVDIRLNLRDALWALAQLTQIQDHLREAERLAEALGDRRRSGWVACYLCQYSWSVVRLDAALEAGKRALAIAEGLPNSALHAETSFYLSLVHLALGDAGRSAAILSTNLRTLDQVVEFHREEFPSPRFAANGSILVRGWMARMLAELGEFAEAETWGHEAIRLGEAANSPFALTTALVGLGASYVRKGQPEQAVGPLERGLELCRAYKFNNWLPTVAASLGNAYVSLGQIDSGLALLEEAVGRGARTGIMSSYSLWLVYLGEAYLHAHRASEALAAAHQAVALCREHMEAGYEAWGLRLLGEIAANADPPYRNEAEARYLEASALAERLGMRPLLARCQLGLGQLHQRIGDRSGAQTYLGRAAELFRALAMPLAEDLSRL